MPRLLIVDDHAIMRRGVRGILSNHSKWEICGEAESGEAAILATSSLKPDIVVMDVSMPGMGGIKATGILHDVSPDVKIILFTLYSSVELVHAGFAAGALGYILKSDVEDELIRGLEAVHRNEYFITSSINPVLAGNIKEEYRRRHHASVSSHAASRPKIKNAKA